MRIPSSNVTPRKGLRRVQSGKPLTDGETQTHGCPTGLPSPLLLPFGKRQVRGWQVDINAKVFEIEMLKLMILRHGNIANSRLGEA